MLALEVLAQHRLAAHHGVEGSQPLLAIHDKQRRGPLLVGFADDPGLHAIGAGLPEQEEADRVATVHGVEQIPDLGIAPDKGTLDVGQANLAHADAVDEAAQGVADFFKKSVSHGLLEKRP